MNLTSIVLFILLFNASLGALSQMGPVFAVNPNNQNLWAPPQNYMNNTAIQNMLQSASACSYNSTGVVTCGENVVAAPSVISSTLTFGNWLWGLLQLLPIMVKAAFWPYGFLTATLGIPAPIAAIWQIGIWFLLLLWLYTTITGRYNVAID